MTGSDDSDDQMRFLTESSVNIATPPVSSFTGRGKSASLAAMYAGTFTTSFSYRWETTSREQRFVGNLLTLPHRYVTDGAQYDDPYDFLRTLVNRIRHDGGHQRDYTLYAGRKAHYWLTSNDYDHMTWLEDAVVDGDTFSVFGMDAVLDTDLVPSDVVVLMNDSKVTFNSVTDHPVGIGLNVGSGITLRLHMDAAGACDIERVGKTDLPENGSHPWQDGTPRIPRIPEGADLYDPSSDPTANQWDHLTIGEDHDTETDISDAIEMAGRTTTATAFGDIPWSPIEDLQSYNRALSPQEIQQIHGLPVYESLGGFDTDDPYPNDSPYHNELYRHMNAPDTYYRHYD